MNSQTTMGQLIDRAPILLCTMRGCPHSDKLRALMSTVSSEVIDVVVNTLPDAVRAQKDIVERSQTLQFPQLFVKGKFVGGFLDTVALTRTGELERMIR